MLTRRVVFFIALLLTLAGQLALAQDPNFELAFCAPIANYPMADRTLGGFDIDIAEVLADELGGAVSVTWTTYDEVGIRDTLHSGLCDVALGVTEGIEGMLTTVPYLKTSYAFVTLDANDLEIESLDDPQLRELRIATYQAGLPSIALQRRGIVDNVIEIAAIIRPTGADSNTPILDALVSGTADVAIVYGPAAAARAATETEALRITPVTPELDFGSNLLQLSRIITLGVRPQDEALRDSLNRALAHRWEDVATILDGYGIPRLPVSAPIDTAEMADSIKVGVIVPARTLAALTNSPTGDDGLRGALVAENTVSIGTGSSAPFLVLFAHAPTVEAVVRAATRLITVDGVDVLVGGYDRAEAEVLARIATQFDTPFFNVGSEAGNLRDAACYPSTFHIAPSTAIMVAASLGVTSSDATQRMHAVLVRDGDEADLLHQLAGLVPAVGAELVGHTIVDAGQYVYYPIINELAASGVDTVVLSMSAEAQEVFMSQAATVAGSPTIIGITPVAGQSRPYLHRFIQVAPELAEDLRVVVWDPAVESPLNATFAARTGEPLEPAAWTTYAAIVIASQAATVGKLESTNDLRAFLQDSSSLIDVGKEMPIAFGSEDGQMRQELYVIQPQVDVAWGRTAAARTALARVVDVIAEQDFTTPESESASTCGPR